MAASVGQAGPGRQGRDPVQNHSEVNVLIVVLFVVGEKPTSLLNLTRRRVDAMGIIKLTYWD